MTALTCEDYTADPQVNVTIPLEGRLTPAAMCRNTTPNTARPPMPKRCCAASSPNARRRSPTSSRCRRRCAGPPPKASFWRSGRSCGSRGYLKTLTPKGQKPLQKRRGGTLPPLRYRSSDGYTILCGRNNLQNDQLTLKTAHGSDLWSHIQKQPGSHVILLTGGTPLEELPDQTIEEAAMLAACNSSGRESSRVPIDYTLVKNIKSRTAPGRAWSSMKPTTPC